MYTGRGSHHSGAIPNSQCTAFVTFPVSGGGCDVLACPGRASGDRQLKFQGHEGDHHGRSHSELLHLPSWAPKVPSTSFKSQKPLAGLATESEADILMKHMLFLRRQRKLCGHIWRWPLLPNTAGQRARTAERALPGQPLIISRPPPCLAPPPPQHTLPQSSYYLQRLACSLGTVIGGRWLRGPENTKGTRIPTWRLSTTSPGTARRTPLEESRLGLQNC